MIFAVAGTAVPPPPQLRQVILEEPLQVAQPTSLSLHLVHMHSSYPEPLHLGHSPVSSSLCSGACSAQRYKILISTDVHNIIVRTVHWSEGETHICMH